VIARTDEMTSETTLSDQSLCVRHPAPPLAGFASLAVPTYRASTINFDTMEDYLRRGERGVDGYSYGLNGTPTTRVLELQITALHRGAGTLIVPSGQAAITLFMLTVLIPGDHLLVTDNVYPPIRRFCSDILGPYGVSTDYFDPLDMKGLAGLIRPNTRLIWMESPGSTTMEVADIPAIVALARPRGILTGCDNTWASPLLLKPLGLGVDMVAEALTKYVGGHSDLLLGAMTFASEEFRARVRGRLSTLGIGVSPDECALALRGIETMAVRLEHVGRVARDFAERLCKFDIVAEVLHPGLPGARGHRAFERDFRGGSGVFSLRLKDVDTSRIGQAMSGMRSFVIGSSWGGTCSIIAPMQVKRGLSGADQISEQTFLRISIGLEAPAELWCDLETLVNRLTVTFGTKPPR
jgi:cysteine-S-conjugate beta-lyase